MKRWILIVAAVMFAAGLVLGGAYVALAQGGTPPVPFGGPAGMMRGWMHSRAFTGTVPFGPGGMMRGWSNSEPFSGTVPFGRGPMMGQGGPLYGTMMLPGGVQEQVWTAVAQELGLTYDQLQAELKTKTLEQLAQDKNVQIEKLQEVFRTAHKTALDQLVQDGKLTREQADWMIQRMDTAGYPMMFGLGRGFGPCHDDDDNTAAPQGFRGRMMPGLPSLPGRSG